MQTFKYIKSFSKGQITIPKEIRDEFAMDHEFWLKLYTQGGKIIAEPVDRQTNKSLWRKKLLEIKQINIDPKEIERNRQEIEEQMQSRAL